MLDGNLKHFKIAIHSAIYIGDTLKGITRISFIQDQLV